MENEVTGRAVGGKASMAKRTPEERKAGASKAAMARHEQSKLPQATHQGDLDIGNAKLQCHVLADGTRVLTQEGFLTALGRAGKAKGGHGANAVENEVDRLPSFIAANNLKPFISLDLMESTSPIVFRTINGVKAFGYKAQLLPKVCRVYLEARDAGVTTGTQAHVVKSADVLMRGLAEVGIIALVDEATGFQKDRSKDALAKILEAFVAKELQPWVKTFPADYYENLFRLYGLPFPPTKSNWRPRFFGHITNNIVYSRLAPELLPELKKAASKAEKKAKLHQFLTSDIGHPKLKDHMASITTILKLSESPDQMMQMVNRVHPQVGKTYEMDFTRLPTSD